jgi:hypothetical protein
MTDESTEVIAAAASVNHEQVSALSPTGWEMPARKPHPRRPRRRTLIDRDGDVWQISKSENMLVGVIEGELARQSFHDVEEMYGPLHEIDSDHSETATDNLLDQQNRRMVGMLRDLALHAPHHPHYTEAQAAAVTEAFTEMADTIENYRRPTEGE